MSQAIGDFVLSCPARRAARKFAALNLSSYVYFFNHTPFASINQAYTEDLGAFHGAEVPYVFYDDYELYGTDEKNLSVAMVDLWRNFAYNGDPNLLPPRSSSGGQGNRGGAGGAGSTTGAGTTPWIRWPKYSTESGSDLNDFYLVLGGRSSAASTTAGSPALWRNVSTVQHLKKDVCDFWDTVAESQITAEVHGQPVLPDARDYLAPEERRGVEWRRRRGAVAGGGRDKMKRVLRWRED